MVYYRNMKQLAYEISQAALNLVFPIFCQDCGKNLPYNNKTYLCQNCYERLRLGSLPICTLTDESLLFSEAWHCYKYEGLIKELVCKFKYHRKMYLKNTLADLLYAFAVEHTQYQKIDILAAVPMHKSDKRKRGFNQSDILAKELSLRLNTKYAERSIQKLKKTKEQVNLKKTERIKNMKNAFVPGETAQVKNKNVLLVDDVFTTGATTNECSRILTKHGANSVSVLTLTKGM